MNSKIVLKNFAIFVLIFANLVAPVSAQVASTSLSSTTSTSTPANIATTTVATSTVMLSGKASWYAYQGGMFAASPDFPRGTVLRVYLQSNPAKKIDVVVNDFGPDRVKHPERVIDLDKVAFAALADLGMGVIGVRIEPIGTTSVRAVSAVSSVPATNKLVKKDALGLTSKSAIVVSAKTGKVLYKKDENLQLPLASLTKIVAAKVFLNTKPNLSKVVAYKKQDENYNKKYASLGEIALLRVKDGETMQLRDYLYASLLGSANNSVETLVRASGLSRETFIYRMNKYAKSVGATKTKFVEPTGLSPENVSSVSDYALISRYALQDGSIEKVTKAKSYTFSTVNTKQRHYIKNTNKLVGNGVTVTGSKTGYLHEAQYCLMTRAKDAAGRQVIAITFGTPNRTASFAETKKLIQYGFTKI
jgi:serine-type D-Ala-D-Ala endopeptidase (penicillin-binding protein 7)